MGRVRRLVLPILLGLAGYYALFGGEYSLFELRKARKDVVIQERELEALRREVDSLRAWVDSLESDSVTLERLARERFGMVREGEVLYRLVEPTVTGSDTLS
jgi:cell division protein FtsB